MPISHNLYVFLLPKFGSYFKQLHIYIYTSLLVLLCTIPALPQQDAHFSQYMFTGNLYNPAYSGIYKQTELYLLYRYQWLGLSSTPDDGVNAAPQTLMFAGSTAIKSINSGIGIHLQNDKIAIYQTIDLKINYSYHINIAKGTLGIGAGIGIVNTSIDAQKLKYNDPSDLRIQNLTSNNSANALDINTGIYYAHPRFFAGLGINRLLSPSLFNSTLNDINYSSQKVRHYFLTAGINIKLSDYFTLVPSTFVKLNIPPLAASSFDINFMLKYNNDKLWGGLSYRHNDAAIIILGIGFLKNNALRAGYAFDLSVIGTQAKAGTSHELFLSYYIPVSDVLARPPIRTPRYRY
ncbi:MAG: type IX secretion system membrane protein PorP/SprF [Cytophagales bacterium]|nr:type IX secretion system membrane protein PorP/SprF [Cytophagales bacterium]